MAQVRDPANQSHYTPEVFPPPSQGMDRCLPDIIPPGREGSKKPPGSPRSLCNRTPQHLKSDAACNDRANRQQQAAQYLYIMVSIGAGLLKPHSGLRNALPNCRRTASASALRPRRSQAASNAR